MLAFTEVVKEEVNLIIAVEEKLSNKDNVEIKDETSIVVFYEEKVSKCKIFTKFNKSRSFIRIPTTSDSYLQHSSYQLRAIFKSSSTDTVGSTLN